MADQETKFSEEELKSLQDLQTSYQQKQLQFGQLKVQKLLVQQQFDAIEKQEEQIEVDYAGVQEQERKLVKELNDKLSVSISEENYEFAARIRDEINKRN